MQSESVSMSGMMWNPWKNESDKSDLSIDHKMPKSRDPEPAGFGAMKELKPHPLLAHALQVFQCLLPLPATQFGVSRRMPIS